MRIFRFDDDNEWVFGEFCMFFKVIVDDIYEVCIIGNEGIWSFFCIYL